MKTSDSRTLCWRNPSSGSKSRGGSGYNFPVPRVGFSKGQSQGVKTVGKKGQEMERLGVFFSKPSKSETIPVCLYPTHQFFLMCHYLRDFRDFLTDEKKRLFEDLSLNKTIHGPAHSTIFHYTATAAVIHKSGGTSSSTYHTTCRISSAQSSLIVSFTLEDQS